MAREKYLGKPCLYGHGSENEKNLRYRSNYQCVECWKARVQGEGKRDKDYLDIIKQNRKTALESRQETYLGGICARNHLDESQKFTLRRTKDKACVKCRKILIAKHEAIKREKNKERKKEKQRETYFGNLCDRKHDDDGQGHSSRFKDNRCCVRCIQITRQQYEERNRAERSKSRKREQYQNRIKELEKPDQKKIESYDDTMKELRRFELELRRGKA